MTSAAAVRIERVLLQRMWDTLEALWDCEAGACSDESPCERCATLNKIRAVLDA